MLNVDAQGSFPAEWHWWGKKSELITTFATVPPCCLPVSAKAVLILAEPTLAASRSREHVAKCWRDMMLSGSAGLGRCHHVRSMHRCVTSRESESRRFSHAQCRTQRNQTSSFYFIFYFIKHTAFHRTCRIFLSNEVNRTLSVFCSSNLLTVPNSAERLPVHRESSSCNINWRLFLFCQNLMELIVILMTITEISKKKKRIMKSWFWHHDVSFTKFWLMDLTLGFHLSAANGNGWRRIRLPVKGASSWQSTVS